MTVGLRRKKGHNSPASATIDHPFVRAPDQLSSEADMGIPRVNRWLLALAVALQPGLAAAQASHVSLTIDEHGVTLDAHDATIGAILKEWERVGGIKVMAPETLND